MNTSQVRNTSIDAARILCAFFVVSLHTKFKPNFAAPFIADIAKIAVPFFLMVSGYYVYRENGINFCGAIVKSLKSTALVLVKSLVIYSVFKLVVKYFFGINLFGNFDAVAFLFFNDPGFTEHLWYLFAYIYALTAIYFMVRFLPSKNINIYTVIFFMGYVTFSIGDKFNSKLDYKAWHELNWIVTGVPFVLIGACVRKNINYIIKIEKKKIIYGIFLALILLFVEHFVLKKIAERGPGVIFPAVLSVLFFVYCVRDFEFFGKEFNNVLSKIGAKYSLNIYIYHVLVRDAVGLVNPVATYNNTICIFFATFALAILVDKIKNLFLKFINLNKANKC